MRFALLFITLLIAPSAVLGDEKGRSGHTDGRSARQSVQQYQSKHFVLHTDLPKSKAAALLGRLEATLQFASTYWQQPLRDPIECYVVDKVTSWPDGSLDPDGRKKIEQGVGLTLVDSERLNGERVRSQAKVYSVAKTGTLLHEAVHAYCGQTFGTTGPLWYAEGMAEVGQYFRAGDAAVHCPPVIINYLRSVPPTTVKEIVDEASVTGDSWKSYARRWALCHVLLNNPNYADRFRKLGLAYLQERPGTFEEHFAAVASQLDFEHRFFIEHLCPGFRADLCAWDWDKPFAPLATGKTARATILARRGWQPSGLTLAAGQSYTYVAEGKWRLNSEGKSVSAAGDTSGAGRLVGAVLNDLRLGKATNFGLSGSFNAEQSGDLYLRCSDEWGSLGDNDGEVYVEFSLRRGR